MTRLAVILVYDRQQVRAGVALTGLPAIAGVELMARRARQLHGCGVVLSLLLLAVTIAERFGHLAQRHQRAAAFADRHTGLQVQLVIELELARIGLDRAKLRMAIL